MSEPLAKLMKEEAAQGRGAGAGYAGERPNNLPELKTPSPASAVVSTVLSPDFTPPPIGTQTVPCIIRLQFLMDHFSGIVDVSRNRGDPMFSVSNIQG